MPRMKILFLLQDIPYPPTDGICWKAYNLIKFLSSRHECHVLSFWDNDVNRIKTFLAELPAVRVIDVVPLPRPGLGLLLKKINKVFLGLPPSLAGYESKIFRQRVEKAICEDQYDVVHYDIINMAQYMAFIPEVPSVHSPNDATSLSCFRKARQEKKIFRKMYMYISAILLRRYERKMYPRFSRVHVVSPVDHQYLKLIDPGIHVETIPIAVDRVFLDARHVPASERTGASCGINVTFVGDLRIQGIVNGLLEFLRESWPLIQRDHPGVRFRVLARHAPLKLQRHLASLPAVEYTLWVENFVEYLQASDVVVFPDKSGTGIKNRVLQAMAMGLPVIGSHAALEGIKSQESFLGTEKLTSAEMAKKVSYLLDSMDRRRLAGDKARLFIQSHYTIDVVGPLYQELYLAMARQSSMIPNKPLSTPQPELVNSRSS